jgi:hypothetical protein
VALPLPTLWENDYVESEGAENAETAAAAEDGVDHSGVAVGHPDCLSYRPSLYFTAFCQ